MQHAINKWKTLDSGKKKLIYEYMNVMNGGYLQDCHKQNKWVQVAEMKNFRHLFKKDFQF